MVYNWVMSQGNHKIVADGQERNYQANAQRVTAEVKARYAAQGQPRSFWQKFWLERQIRQEVQKRLGQQFPSKNNYFAAFLK
jgi:hypothetical protein